MTTRRTLRQRLAVAAVATLTASLPALAACSPTTSTDDPGEPSAAPGTAEPSTAETSPAARPRRTVPPGRQNVRAPGPQDAVLPGAALSQPTPVQRSQQPNLLMITVDDATMQDLEFLPVLQKEFGDNGIRLDNGIAPTPICVPARASLVTGQYTHNHGALTISGAGGGYAAFDDAATLPGWLQRVGYDTLFIGKYLNGYGKNGTEGQVPPGWTDWQATLDPSTYNYAAPKLSNNGNPVVYDQYSTDLFADLTVQRINDPRRATKPWYLWVNYVAPHFGGPKEPDDPSIKTPAVAEEFRDTKSKVRLPSRPDMFEKNVSDKIISPGTQTVWDARGRAELRELRQQRLESLQSVDRAIGETFDALRSTGQLKNTYVVFTSDNGYAVGEHNIQGKLWFYDDILRVPMYIVGPGLGRGKVSQTPVSNADWAPTFAALAGAKPGRNVDGVDVLPWLNTKADRRVIPIEAYPVKGGKKPRYVGVTVGPWTYVHGRRQGSAELYNRDIDPFQLTNVARDPRFQDLKNELRALSNDYRDCAGKSCPTEFYRDRS